MICDGGDYLKGCGKNFHVLCVGLAEIPQGDWVCSECAKAYGYEVIRMEGHEFPVDCGADEHCAGMLKDSPSKDFGAKSYDKKHKSIDDSSDEDSGNNLNDIG